MNIFGLVGLERNNLFWYYHSLYFMLLHNTTLLGLVIGALPSISDKQKLGHKLIPSLMLIVLIALLDWADKDTWWFMLFCLLN